MCGTPCQPPNCPQRTIELDDIDFPRHADHAASRFAAAINIRDRDNNDGWIAAQADDAVMDQVLCTHNGDVLIILNCYPRCANGDESWSKTHNHAHQDH